uniref:Uncharacterized protein n=1 Tax=Anguilla anguilla TaxID=7936 RepID=A0A0E9U6R4_ANGAN
MDKFVGVDSMCLPGYFLAKLMRI